MSARVLPLQYLKGVGPRRAEVLAQEGIVTPEDVLLNVPKSYVDRAVVPNIAALQMRFRRPSVWDGTAPAVDVRVATEVSIVATIELVQEKVVGKGRAMLDAQATDDSGATVHLVFWNRLAYYKKALRSGGTYLVSGVPEFDVRWNRLTMHHPDVELIDDDDIASLGAGVILPKYTITQAMSSAGITVKGIRSIVDQVLAAMPTDMPDPIPTEVRLRRSLVGRGQAIRALHRPQAEIEIADARRRMKFEELFLFELVVATKHANHKLPSTGIVMDVRSPRARTVMDALPYRLTTAQQRVVREIMQDVSSGAPMNRLLQGDVGSGKTIVALLVMLNAVDNGYQAAIMAPTEILAEQHYHAITSLMGSEADAVQLVTGSQRSKARKEAAERIANGEARIVVGTHALFEADVEYNRLGLVVIDEQHRFGVAQRAQVRLLAERSHSDRPRTPHILVMSATPIPRTLSMTLYGDLDVSVIDELPAGRRPIVTKVVSDADISAVHQHVRSEVTSGRQAYVVYPLVEKSEKVAAKSAVEHYTLLRESVYPDLRLALLHGQMDWNEKENIMRAFKDGAFDILVSTTVIEVGIDVPNATVMVIENAERFGLSQLHQLRGRVGRGGDRSYCYLVAGQGATWTKRLRIMEQTTDGFRIAEEDLRLRGPGDLLGVRQSGVPEFRFADLVSDGALIAEARADAFDLVARDPRLLHTEHAATRLALQEGYAGAGFHSVA